MGILYQSRRRRIKVSQKETFRQKVRQALSKSLTGSQSNWSGSPRLAPLKMPLAFLRACGKLATMPRGGKRPNTGGPRPGSGRPRLGEIRVRCTLPRAVYELLLALETPERYRTRIAAQILTQVLTDMAGGQKASLEAAHDRAPPGKVYSRA
jgi:hypothetical protein